MKELEHESDVAFFHGSRDLLPILADFVQSTRSEGGQVRALNGLVKIPPVVKGLIRLEYILPFQLIGVTDFIDFVFCAWFFL